MRAAVYARYSSENQRPESIDDQVLACRKLANEREMSIEDRHIFTDRAASGARKDRPGLGNLLQASESCEFQVVLVDDLSRLARDNFLMLTILAELRFRGVEVVSVADGLETDDEENMLGIQIRGIFNELQLRDLRKKTLRGQLGQKQRGFSVGERTFGYRSFPVGEMRLDKKGRPRPDGYRMEIYPSEAATVLRIFTEYTDGTPIIRIVKRLNQDGVSGRVRSANGWSPATISRMLRNEKYIGRWVWNRTEARRDPKTGRKRQFPKAESEWVVQHDEKLRIIPQSVWQRVVRRMETTKQTWPGSGGKRSYAGQTGSEVRLYPKQLFSGAMFCGTCGHSIGQVSGKGGGYYGCISAAKRACENRVLVRRSLVERILIAELRDAINSVENVDYVLQRVAKEVRDVYRDVPETIRLKSQELEGLERKIANFVSFIGEGRGSAALASALAAAEREAESLRREVAGLEANQDSVFEPPPRIWIEERVATLQSILEGRTGKSALLLRQIFGPIRLKPVVPDVGRPYFRAESELDVLALVEFETGLVSGRAGSNSLREWSQRDSNPCYRRERPVS